jgi:hypothetical protein
VGATIHDVRPRQVIAQRALFAEILPTIAELRPPRNPAPA